MSQQEPTIELKQPTSRGCSDEEFTAFCDIVKKGKQVDPVGLKDRMRAAEVLAFLRYGNEIVGVGALKQQPAEYTDNIFKAAHSSHRSADFALELGWVVVLKKGNGYSHRVVAALVNYADGQP